MEVLQIIVFLLMCSVALGWVARHFAVPYPITLVLGGCVLGFIPGLPQVPFDPEVIMALVLPPILYQAALMTSWRDFKAQIRSIGLLAIGLVIVTTLAVGASLKLLVPECPWAVAFVLGAIVSPPDAVAATAILSHLNVPRRVVTILEGESLVNDASGLVLYKFAVAAVMTGAFSLFDVGVQFTVLAVGGVAVGGLLSMLFVAIHRRLGDTLIEVLTLLSVPYVAYIVAETLHVSGVLAVVTAGMVRGRYSPRIVSPRTRIIGRSAWMLLVFLLNSVVFMLIGLQLSGIVDRLGQETALELAVAGALVSSVAIIVRFAWIYPAAGLSRLIGEARHRPEQAQSSAELFIMSWCGMRGIVSLVAALALPLALPGGESFPYRDLIIFLTFVVIATTLVLQGLSLPVLIRTLKVGHDSSQLDEAHQARVMLEQAANAAIERYAAEHALPPSVLVRVRAEFGAGPVAGAGEADQAGHAAASDEVQALGRMRQAVLRARREELIRIWRRNLISDEVLHDLEEDLDYRESYR